jgi:hypothetical protein
MAPTMVPEPGPVFASFSGVQIPDGMLYVVVLHFNPKP